jgi:CheY-like chemotaxis protein
MSRKSRIDIPGALYHVIARDNQEQDIFSSESDYKAYIDFKGSVFTVYLPRVEADSSKDSPDESPIPIGKETILVVDDEEYQVQSMGDMLERLGYRVTGKTRSLEALELFRQQPGYFDLVITDEVMPGITGSRLAEELLTIRPDLPIILSTGYSETINGDRAREIEIRELMMKPFGVREIATTIRRVLER